jgi:hypothetical protein
MKPKLIVNIAISAFLFVGFSLISSNLVSAATFSVNETGDQGDASAGDGVCDRDGVTPGSQCTLRAAIEEANALGGADNIHFNIPTSDSGYRDYDTPNSSSSGDSLGGDDYWLIQPSAQLPIINTQITIDGSTQTASQLDSNISGPEIEIDFHLANPGTTTEMIRLQSGANGSSIAGLTLGYTDDGLLASGRALMGLTSVSNITISDNYIGMDVKGLNITANRSNGIEVNTGVTNLTIEDNLISGFTSSSGDGADGIQLSCQNASPNIIIRANRFGLSSNTISGLTSAGHIEINSCGVTIGGDNPSDRNYFVNASYAAGAVSINTATVLNPNVYIFNNYFSTDPTATIDLRNYMDISIFADEFAGTPGEINIGDAGKGNLFKYSHPNKSIYKTASDIPIVVSYNSFGNNRAGIDIHNGSSNVDILNNWFGNTTSDPYFGVALGNSNQSPLLLKGENITLKGNYINAAGASTAIEVTYSSTDPKTRLNASDDSLGPIIIGGSSLLTGSLCDGLERNCIVGATVAGIQSRDTVPTNESTLYADNNFLTGNGPSGNTNVIQWWKGSIELVSGSYRHTELPTGLNAYPLPALPNTILSQNTTNTIPVGTNSFNISEVVDCNVSSDCPSSHGTNGKTYIYSSGSIYNAPLSIELDVGNNTTWPYIAEYKINGSGVKTDYSIWKFDTLHLISNTFSFDGNSTTHPQTYPGVGEPWTSSPTANRNVATQDFGRFQLMEVQVVDANPILNGDGSYTILVDSTSDEDNVSLTGFNDGSGAYTGGGTSGVNGAANGKTSFREAVIVANQFPANVIKKIVFCLSDGLGGDSTGLNGILNFACGSGAADANYNLTGSENKWKINIESSISVTNENVQILANQNYNWTNPNSYPDPSLSQPRIILNINNTTSNLQLTNNNIVLKGLQIERSTSGSGTNVFSNSNSQNIVIGGSGSLERNVIWKGGRNIYFTQSIGTIIQGNFIGIGPNGIEKQSVNGDYSLSFGSLTNQNLQIGGLGLARNYVSGGYVAVEVFGPNNTIENNFVGLGYDGTTVLNIGDGIRFGNGVDSISYENTMIVNNVISGFSSTGIDYSSETSDIRTYNVEIYGNKVGIDISGQGNPHANTTGIILWGFGGIKLGDSSDTSKANIIGPGEYGLDLWLGNADLGINYIGRNADNTQQYPIAVAIYYWGEFMLNSWNLEISNDVSVSIRVNRFSTDNSETFDLSMIRKLPGTIASIDIINLNVDYLGKINTNDIGDVDGIVNGGCFSSSSLCNPFMNWPEITEVKHLGSDTYQISGKVEGKADEAPFNIQICESYYLPTLDQEHGGCAQYLTQVTTASTSPYNWSTTVSVSGDPTTKYFAATATNINGSTSEFSNNKLTEFFTNLLTPENNSNLLDKTPTLDWTDSTDPNFKEYQLFLNNSLYAIATQSSYTIPGDLNTGGYTWQIKAIRNDDSISSTSEVWNFNIVEDNNSYSINLISPEYGSKTTEKRPVMDWTDSIDPNFKHYQIYVDNSLVATSVNSSYTPITDLELGEHSWRIVSVRNNNSVSFESSVWIFEIISSQSVSEPIVEPPVSTPVIPVDDNSIDQPTKVDNIPTNQISAIEAAKFIPQVLPALVGALTTIGTISIFAGGIPNIGVLLGLLLNKKKKYFGIVYDEATKEIVPFAQIELYKGNKLIDRSISDLKGRYALSMEQEGEYLLKTKAGGYNPKDITISRIFGDKLVTFDIALIRSSDAKLGTQPLFTSPKISFISNILLVLWIVGFIYSLYVLIINPVFLNYLIVLVYLIMICINGYLKIQDRLDQTNVIKDSHGNPMAGVIYKAIDRDGNIVDTGITNNNGVVRLRLAEGNYKLLLFKEVRSQTEKFISITNTGRIVGDLTLKNNFVE